MLLVKDAVYLDLYNAQSDKGRLEMCGYKRTHHLLGQNPTRRRA